MLPRPRRELDRLEAELARLRARQASLIERLTPQMLEAADPALLELLRAWAEITFGIDELLGQRFAIEHGV